MTEENREGMVFIFEGVGGKTPPASSSPNSLSTTLALLITFVAIVLIVAIYWSDIIAPLFPTSLFQTQLVGVIIGGMLTLGSSYVMFSLQNHRELQNIARGFISELEIYHDWNQYILSTYSAVGTGAINTSFINELNRPIFTDQSLFYIFRKEMFSFNGSIVTKMLEFYSHLKAAEEERRRIRQYAVDEENGLVENFRQIVESQGNLAESIRKADALIPALVIELNAIVTRKI